MKKIAKQFAFIVSIIFLMTPILSACFMTTPLYRVSLFGGAGGVVDFKIGKTNLVSGSSYKKGSKITITVTTYETHTIKSVRAGSTILVADTVSQLSENVTKATYTHKLTAEVTLVVEYVLKNISIPPPPPPACEGSCGVCENCLEIANLKTSVLSILDCMLFDVFEGANNALVIISQAKTDINAVNYASGVKNFYSNAMYRLFADLMQEECGCYACSICVTLVIKGQIIKMLISTTLGYENDLTTLLIIVDAIKETGTASSAIGAMTMFTEVPLEIEGKFIINDTVTFMLNQLKTQSSFFNDFETASEAIVSEIILPAIIEYPQSIIAVFSTNLGLLQSYIMYTMEEFYSSIAQGVIDGGFIKDGKEIAFKLAFLGQ